MNIEWNKVTRYSQALAIVLFVCTFFLGFWLGTMKDEETNVPQPSPEFANNALEEKGDEIQIAKLSTERPLDNENTSQEYRIVSPKAGETFYEDDPIVVRWESNDSSEPLDIYLLPSNCSDGFCDDEFPLRTLVGFSEEEARTSTLSLRDGSPNVAYPEGEYRIVLKFSWEGSQPVLATSDPFTILPPRDKSRDIWIGDRRGDFIITDLSVYTFSTVGTTTVRGFAFIDPMLQKSCFDVIEDDYDKLPRPDSDGRSGWFCFNNHIPQELLDAEGTTTIQIADYFVDGTPRGSADGADFVQIIR